MRCRGLVQQRRYPFLVIHVVPLRGPVDRIPDYGPAQNLPHRRNAHEAGEVPGIEGIEASTRGIKPHVRGRTPSNADTRAANGSQAALWRDRRARGASTAAD